MLQLGSEVLGGGGTVLGGWGLPEAWGPHLEGGGTVPVGKVPEEPGCTGQVGAGGVGVGGAVPVACQGGAS